MNSSQLYVLVTHLIAPQVTNSKWALAMKKGKEVTPQPGH